MSTPSLSVLIPTLAGGGAERVAAMLATQLMQEADVRVALFQPEVHYETSAPLTILGVDLTSARWWQRLPAGIGRYAAEMRKTKPDVALSFMMLPNLMNVMVNARRRRTVLSVRTPLSLALPTTWKGQAFRHALQLAFPKADAIVALSEGVRQDLIHEFGLAPSVVHTIHNPIDLDAVASRSREAIPANLEELFEHGAILNVARLVDDKGQWTLIRSFALAKPKLGGERLVLVGSGPLLAYLEECAHACELKTWVAKRDPESQMLKADVIFLGHVQDPFHLMRAAKLFAFSSVREGFGNVLIEALCAGVPVLSSDCPCGPREILAPSSGENNDSPEYGVLVPAAPQEKVAPQAPPTQLELHWAERLVSLLRDQETLAKLATLGPARATCFSIDVIAKKWQELLFS